MTVTDTGPRAAHEPRQSSKASPGPIGALEGSQARERVRCPHCHHACDIALIWASVDCCPRCLKRMMISDHPVEMTVREHLYEPLTIRLARMPEIPSPPKRLLRRKREE